ncbi:MAG TPA: RcpC/CpaB family pilus assembly protein [Mycobacteriales bacterium]|jgi:Flp pilus assembly protein CpaB|nr:RcpC/CpaB family pilus assembly protein [Mycobacteriales bacterium]
MKSRNNLVIAVGVVLALLGAGFAVAYLRGTEADARATASVVVATAAVPAGTPAANAKLVVKAVDVSAVPPNAVTNLAALTGQVSLVALAQNQVVTPAMFGVRGAAASGGVVLPPGKKGIGVELGFAPGALRYVVPTNRIDVYASRKTGDTVRTEVLLRDVQVIATTPGTGTGEATAVQSGPGTLDFLLAVDEAQALKIVNAQASQWSLYFTLAGARKAGA